MDDITISFTYRPGEATHIAGPYGQSGKSTFEVAETSPIDKQGKPLLPVAGQLVRIPDGTVFDGLDAYVRRSHFYESKYDVLPAPQPISEGEPPVFVPDYDIYSRNAFYPAAVAEYVGTVDVGGVQCVNVAMYPVKWNPKTLEAAELTEIEVVLRFKKGGNLQQPGVAAVHPLIRSRIIGLEAAEAAVPAKILIVTSAALANAMTDYVAAKTSDFDVTVVLIEDIVPPVAANPAAALRAFVQAEHQRSPLYALVLGGNVDVIPTNTRTATYPTTPTRTVDYASDSYYAADYDNGQYFPNFLVWRFPASSPAEMEQQCRRAVRYKGDADAKRKNALFTTYWGNTAQGGDYNVCSDEICNYIALHNPHGLHIHKCYADASCKG